MFAIIFHFIFHILVLIYSIVRLSMCTLRVRLREALPGNEVHDGGLAGGQAQRGQSHVAVQEPALTNININILHK